MSYHYYVLLLCVLLHRALSLSLSLTGSQYNSEANIMQDYYEPFLPPTLVLALSIEKQACHHRAASP